MVKSVKIKFQIWCLLIIIKIYFNELITIYIYKHIYNYDLYIYFYKYKIKNYNFL